MRPPVIDGVRLGTPGVEQAIFQCAGPGCAWFRHAVGRRAIDRTTREAQRHADDKNHPIEIHHRHPVRKADLEQ